MIAPIQPVSATKALTEKIWRLESIIKAKDIEIERLKAYADKCRLEKDRAEQDTLQQAHETDRVRRELNKWIGTYNQLREDFKKTRTGGTIGDGKGST